MIPLWFQERLARPRVAAAVVVVGVSLCAPGLANGLALDDVLLAARYAEGGATVGNLFGLFGGADPLVALADQPWWRHDGMRLDLLRPLAAATHLFDLRWFAAAPVWMHVHSLLWYGVLLAVAGNVYRRLVPGPHAWALGSLFYAVDHTHGMVVGWLASRSAILGAIGALLCLAAHDRWRSGGRGRDLGLAIVALLAALLASEGAVGVVGYLAAYALCRERGAWLGRVASIVPAVVVVIGWRVCYVAAGHGAAHSGFYFDPGTDPLGFFVRGLVHATLLVGSAVFVPLGEGLGMVPGLYGPGAAVVVCLLAGVLMVVRDTLRRSSALRFWAVGALLCALPLGSTLPTDRQLLLVGFGVFGFVATLLAEPREVPRSCLVRGLAWLWLGVHLVLSPLLVPLRAGASGQIHGLAEAATDAVVPGVATDRVMLVRVPSDLVMLYGRASRELDVRPFPGSLQYLYAGLDALTITRVDAQTLELRSATGWLYAPLDRLYSDPIADPFEVGEQVVREGMVIEILAISGDGAPTRVRVRFDRPLDRLTWYTWEGRVPRAFGLPVIGESVVSAAQSNPMLAL